MWPLLFVGLLAPYLDIAVAAQGLNDDTTLLGPGNQLVDELSRYRSLRLDIHDNIESLEGHRHGRDYPQRTAYIDLADDFDAQSVQVQIETICDDPDGAVQAAGNSVCCDSSWR